MAPRVLVLLPASSLASAWACALRGAGLPVLELHARLAAELRTQALEVFAMPATHTGRVPAPRASDPAAAGAGAPGEEVRYGGGLVMLATHGALQGVCLPHVSLVVQVRGAAETELGK